MTEKEVDKVSAEEEKRQDLGDLPAMFGVLGLEGLKNYISSKAHDPKQANSDAVLEAIGRTITSEPEPMYKACETLAAGNPEFAGYLFGGLQTILGAPSRTKAQVPQTEESENLERPKINIEGVVSKYAPHYLQEGAAVIQRVLQIEGKYTADQITEIVAGCEDRRKQTLKGFVSMDNIIKNEFQKLGADAFRKEFRKYGMPEVVIDAHIAVYEGRKAMVVELSEEPVEALELTEILDQQEQYAHMQSAKGDL